MPITACRGTVDILPAETARWRHLEEAAHRLAQLFGYRELRTPAFEATELFTESLGDDAGLIDKELYTFRDKSGRSLTLRPEMTVPTVRAWLEHNLGGQALSKIYYLAEIWRYERPQAGRTREAHQFGVEAVGSASPAVDAELVDLALTYFAQLGLKSLRLEVNSVGCKRCRPAYQQVLRDFFLGKDDVLCPDCERHKESNPIRILDCKKDTCLAITNTAPTVFQSLCSECKNHFFSFKDHLAQMGHEVHGNLRVVHGLNYYTRTAFQIHSTHLGQFNPICVGGRFDDLIAHLGSNSTPAAGFAAGLERVLLALEKDAVSPPEEPRLDVFLVGTGEEAERIMSRTAHQLRMRGHRVDRDYTTRGVKNQLKLSEKLNPTYTVVVGEEDTRVTQVTVSDNGREVQETVNVNRLIENLDFRLRRDERGRGRERVEAVEESPRRGREERGRRGRRRDGMALPDERAPREAAARERTAEGEEGARFSEWAATYAEAARLAVPRPTRRVPLSQEAFETSDPPPTRDVWAQVQEGLLAPSASPDGPWPPAPIALTEPPPPRRERAPLPLAAPNGASWLEEAEEGVIIAAAGQDMAPVRDQPPGELPPDEAEDADEDDEGDDEDAGLATAAAGNGNGDGERRRRGGRRGGRRHGRRRPRAKS